MESNNSSLDPKKLCVQNRVLQESFKVILEFKRILQTIFNDPMLAKNSRVFRLQTHFNYHMKRYEVFRNSFDDTLTKSIDRLDDRCLTNCFSSRCPLVSCSPEEEVSMEVHSDGGYLEKSNKRTNLNDHYVEADREDEIELNDDGDDEEMMNYHNNYDRNDAVRDSMEHSMMMVQPRPPKKIKTPPTKVSHHQGGGSIIISNNRNSVDNKSIDNNQNIQNNNNSTLVPIANDDDCFVKPNIKTEFDQPEVEIDCVLDESIDDQPINSNLTDTPNDTNNIEDDVSSKQAPSMTSSDIPAATTSTPILTNESIATATTTTDVAPATAPTSSSSVSIEDGNDNASPSTNINAQLKLIPIAATPNPNILLQHLSSTPINSAKSPTTNRTQLDKTFSDGVQNQNKELTQSVATPETATTTETNLNKNKDNSNSSSQPVPAKYPCRVMNCKEVFNSAHEVYAHVKQHSKLFKCSVCNGLFTSKKEVFNHFKSTHDSSAKNDGR